MFMEDEVVKEEGEPKDPQADPTTPETPVVPENKVEEPAGAKPADEARKSGESNEENLSSEDKGRLFEIKKLRADRRALREENEALKAERDARDHQPLPENNQEGAEEEPHNVEYTVRNVLQQERLKEHREEAFNHILSQDDVSTDKELNEIGEVMRDTGLDILAQAKPFQAAELALREWRRVRAERSSKASPGEKASAQDIPKGGVKPGGGNSAKKLWSRKDIEDMSDSDYEKNRSELLAASKEGRIK